MDEEAGAFDVLEKLVAESRPGVGPFDEAGDVGHGEGLLVPDGHHAQVGVLGGEGVVGDFGMSPGEPAEERGLPGVRFANDPDVGDDLEFESDSPLFALLARLKFAGGAVGGGFEVVVPPPPPASLGDHHAVAQGRQVLQHMTALGVADDGAWGDLDDHIFGTAPLLVRAFARATIVAPPVLVPGERGQVIDVGGGLDDDAASGTAIASTGPPLGNLVFAAEADAAISTIAPFYIESDPVKKHGAVSRAGGSAKWVPERTRPRFRCFVEDRRLAGGEQETAALGGPATPA